MNRSSNEQMNQCMVAWGNHGQAQERQNAAASGRKIRGGGPRPRIATLPLRLGAAGFKPLGAPGVVIRPRVPGSAHYQLYIAWI